MIELLARNWGLLIFRGVLGIGFGIMAMIWPNNTVMALVFLWSAYVIVDAMASIAMGVADPGSERWILFATGILGLLAGGVAIALPVMTTVILLLIIAAWAVAIGIMYLLTAWRVRREVTGEWLLVLAGLSCIALGVVLFLQPEAGALGLLMFIGALVAVWGVCTFILGLRMRSFAKPPPAETYDSTRTV